MTNKFWSWVHDWMWRFVYLQEVWRREKTFIKWWRKWKELKKYRIEQWIHKRIRKWKTPRLKYKKCEDLGQRLLHRSVWSGDRENTPIGKGR